MSLECKLNSQESCNFYICLTLAFLGILYIFPKIPLTMTDGDGRKVFDDRSRWRRTAIKVATIGGNRGISVFLPRNNIAFLWKCWIPMEGWECWIPMRDNNVFGALFLFWNAIFSDFFFKPCNKHGNPRFLYHILEYIKICPHTKCPHRTLKSCFDIYLYTSLIRKIWSTSLGSVWFDHFLFLFSLKIENIDGNMFGWILLKIF